MTDLLSLQDYCIFTFISTSHALKGEKVMKQAEAHFVMMPTPREVSTSCGLAIKVNPVEVKKYYQLLVEHRVSIEGVFRLTRNGHKTEVQNLEFS
jgi:hypothetical protein